MPSLPSDHGDPDSQPDDEVLAIAPPVRRNLVLAIASGVIFATLFVGSALLDRWVVVGFIAVAMTIAMLELSTALRAADLRPPTAIVIGGGIGMLVGAYVAGAAGQLAALVVTVLGIVLWALTDRDDGRPLRSAGGALLIALWVGLLASFIGLLLRRDSGQWYLVLTVALTAASDIAAYAAGSQFGRHKLAPAISPGKTWEGVIGSVVVTSLVAAALTPLVITELTIARAAVFGAVVAVVATIGDLSESMVKRSLGVKDLGSWMPGHGGMMDRVDAMLFTFPVAHLVLLAGGL